MNRKYTDDELRLKKYYYLTLLEPERRPYQGWNQVFWKCQCDCGNIVYRLERVITTHKTKSCGCKHPRHNKGQNHPQWEGCGDLNQQYFGVLKTRALERNLSFEITIKEAWDKFIEQDRKCALTGLYLNIEAHRDKRKGIEQTASLDRIDSTKGYTIDNIQWVHKIVNHMKNKYSQEKFIEICRLVASKFPEDLPQKCL